MCPESTDCEMKKLFAVSVKFRLDVSSKKLVQRLDAQGKPPLSTQHCSVSDDGGGGAPAAARAVREARCASRTAGRDAS